MYCKYWTVFKGNYYRVSGHQSCKSKKSLVKIFIIHLKTFGYLGNGWTISFFPNAQILILNCQYIFRFSISLIVFSLNAKNLLVDLAAMKSAILQNSDVMEKNGCRIRTQRPKIIWKQLVLFQDNFGCWPVFYDEPEKRIKRSLRVISHGRLVAEVGLVVLNIGREMSVDSLDRFIICQQNIAFTF